MKASFRNSLIKYFIFFALIPTVLLILIGYYIASESFESQYELKTEPMDELIDYYNQTFFDEIQIDLVNYSKDASLPELDFLIRNDSAIIIDTAYSVLSLEEFKNLALASAETNNCGFFQYNNRYWQYCKIIIENKDVIIGGISHELKYSQLIEDMQQSQVKSTTFVLLKKKYIYFLIIVFFILLLVITILAYYFSSKISKNLSLPINELSIASQKIAGGDFNQQVTARGIGEINTLIDNFNRMTKELKTTTAKLTQSERVAAWRHLARRFAHELKNPLQPIIISLYQIEKKLKEGDQYHQFAESFQAASEELKHLMELSDRFSTLAKLPPPKLKRTNLNELLKSLVKLYEVQLNDYDFQLKLPKAELNYNLDATYFREAIHNLLKNAVEASSENGKIILRLVKEEDNIKIIIHDFGSGIKSDIESSVRIPYFTTKDKGSGLGLAIAEKTVNELNGNLIIESEEGVGTKITISLPII